MLKLERTQPVVPHPGPKQVPDDEGPSGLQVVALAVTATVDGVRVAFGGGAPKPGMAWPLALVRAVKSNAARLFEESNSAAQA